METEARDVLDRFHVTPAARAKYRKWREDPARPEVVQTVTSHVSRVVYRLTPQDIQAVCEATDHALGDIEKRTIEDIDLAENWYPTYAFVHLFHYQMELLGKPPRWQDFEDYFYRTDTGMRMFGAEKLRRQAKIERDHHPKLVKRFEKVNITDEQIEKKARIDAENSLTWRIGNAY